MESAPLGYSVQFLHSQVAVPLSIPIGSGEGWGKGKSTTADGKAGIPSGSCTISRWIWGVQTCSCSVNPLAAGHKAHPAQEAGLNSSAPAGSGTQLMSPAEPNCPVPFLELGGPLAGPAGSHPGSNRGQAILLLKDQALCSLHFLIISS